LVVRRWVESGCAGFVWGDTRRRWYDGTVTAREFVERICSHLNFFSLSVFIEQYRNISRRRLQMDCTMRSWSCNIVADGIATNLALSRVRHLVPPPRASFPPTSSRRNPCHNLQHGRSWVLLLVVLRELGP
jgi:hypothetical protein